ncbi:hypothetical protein [Devosia ginsengisoli]|uniref:hypothetical protein n=1 Tax=Devosia ginsengisoli TaxID=400770 RepID=UPI001FE70767|nr:hypothetical protein [Devosia ginsengisoli]
MRALTRRFAVKLAMRKPSPERIPLAGDAVYARNYFTTQLGTSKTSREYVVLSINQRGYDCYYFDPETRARTEEIVPFERLSRLHVRVRQYYREIQIDYQSASEFLTYQALGLPWIFWLRERIAQAAFNRQKLVRAERNRMVRLFLEKSLETPGYSATAISVLSELHGDRWVLHPDNAPVMAYYDLLLDSLVSSGHLSNHQGQYVLEPAALALLDAFEQDERHHNDMVRQQRLLAGLTGALVLIGALQAGAAILSAWKNAAPLI